MIPLLINLIILMIVLGLIYWALTLLPLPAPFPTIIKVAMILIAVLVILHFLLPMAGGHALLL